jgi:hypothetical protein
MMAQNQTKNSLPNRSLQAAGKSGVKLILAKFAENDFILTAYQLN